MSAVTDYDERGRRFLEIMETIFGRKRAADMLGLKDGTLENVRRFRRKSLSTHLYETLRGGLIRGLEQEITRLQHEVDLARACSLGGGEDEVAAAAAALEQARALIKGAAR